MGEYTDTAQPWLTDPYMEENTPPPNNYERYLSGELTMSEAYPATSNWGTGSGTYQPSSSEAFIRDSFAHGDGMPTHWNTGTAINQSTYAHLDPNSEANQFQFDNTLVGQAAADQWAAYEKTEGYKAPPKLGEYSSGASQQWQIDHGDGAYQGFLTKRAFEIEQYKIDHDKKVGQWKTLIAVVATVGFTMPAGWAGGAAGGAPAEAVTAAEGLGIDMATLSQPIVDAGALETATGMGLTTGVTSPIPGTVAGLTDAVAAGTNALGPATQGVIDGSIGVAADGTLNVLSDAALNTGTTAPGTQVEVPDTGTYNAEQDYLDTLPPGPVDQTVTDNINGTNPGGTYNPNVPTGTNNPPLGQGDTVPTPGSPPGTPPGSPGDTMPSSGFNLPDWLSTPENWLDYIMPGIQTYLADQAAGDAADVYERTSEAQLAEIQRQYDQDRTDNEPWRTAGSDALGRLGSIYGQDNSDPSSPDYSAFYRSPGYNFMREEGMQGIENRFSAGGSGLQSGNALKALGEYTTGLAGQEYGNYFNRELSMAGLGSAANAQSAYSGANSVNQTMNALGNQGDARASGILGQGAARNNGLSTLMDNMLRRRGR